MIKVTIDTNVIISAILFGGKPEVIIKLAEAQKIALVLSQDILAETAYVLRSKFSWENHKIEMVEAMFRQIALFVTPQQRLKLIKADDPDNRILECALEGSVDFIVCGDKKHLLPLNSFKGIPIIEPAMFIKQYQARFR
jgi:uncharacterized protein